MAIAPFLHALVEIDEPFAHFGVLRILAVDLDQDRLQLFGRLHIGGDVTHERRGGHGIALARQVAEKCVPERVLPEARLERRPGAAPGREPLDGRARLPSQRELELTELIRLKPARRFETFAKGQEFERRHRLEDVELRDEHLEDGEHPLQRVLGAIRVVRCEQHVDPIDFVENFLEPELVDLMNDDEEQLVVLGPLGARLLESEQLVDMQIAAVGNDRIHAVSLSDSDPSCPSWTREAREQ